MLSSGTVGNKGNFCKKRHAAAIPLKRRAARRQAGSVAKVDNMQMNSSWKCRHASEIYASHNNQGMTKATFLQLAEYLFMKKGSLWLIIEANCCLEARAKKNLLLRLNLWMIV